LEAARNLAEAAGNLWIMVGTTGVLANVYVAEGRLGRARKLHQEAISQALRPTGERLFPPAGFAYAGLGRVLYEQGEIDEARRCFTRAIELGEMIGFWRVALVAFGPLAWLEYMQGNNAVAHTLMRRAVDLAEKTRDTWEFGPWVTDLMAYEARISLAESTPKPDAAERWATSYQQREPDETHHAEGLSQLTLARVELARGQSEQALARLDRLEKAALAGGRVDSLIKILALQSCALAARGESDEATQRLDRALEQGAREGYVRSFLDEGQPMVRLLGKSHHPYAARLLRRLEIEKRSRQADVSPALTSEGLAEALNARELQVLRLFAAGLTNAEVAQELFISVNTVKWYAKNIYRKLGVHRRARAVAKGRELGLIPRLPDIYPIGW
jgi:LuxR family maltose regulon positive regulatory protein